MDTIAVQCRERLQEMKHATQTLKTLGQATVVNNSMKSNSIFLISSLFLVLAGIGGCQPAEETKSTNPVVRPAGPEPKAEPKAEPKNKPDSDRPAGSLTVETTKKDKPKSTRLRFIDGTKQSQIAFQHQAGRTENRWMPEIMGSGVLVADFNRDGSPDLFAINGGKVDQRVRPPGAGNRLFLNDGKGTFRDVSDEWKVPSKAYGMGGAVGDFNNDGWPDIYLTSYGGGDQLLLNNGQGFRDVTASAGIETEGKWSSSAAFLDYDRDGHLDLYVTRYVDYDSATALKSFVNGFHVYSTPLLYNGISDQLWRNKGDGTFVDASESLFSGTSQEQKSPDGKKPAQAVNQWKGLAVGVGDLNGDDWPDIYVANDTCANLMFINDQKGKFQESARLAGVAYGDTGKEQAGMGVDFSDLDGDSRLEIACTNFQGEPANLFFQSRPQFFVDQTDARGLGRSSRARMQWGIRFFDADNDGDDDLAIANGHLYDQIETMVTGVTFGQPNSLLENDGTGRLNDVSELAGPAFEDRQVSRGLATGDLNGDGRQDLVFSNNAGTLQVALNATTKACSFVSLWLEGKPSNRSAIGTKLNFKIGDRKIQKQVFGGTSYLSASDLRVHVGTGSAKVVDELTVKWPSGTTQVFKGLAADTFYRLEEGGQPETYVPGSASASSE